MVSTKITLIETFSQQIKKITERNLRKNILQTRECIVQSATLGHSSVHSHIAKAVSFRGPHFKNMYFYLYK